MGLNREKKAFKGRIREVEVTFTLAEVQAAGAVTSLAKTFGDIPPDAVVLHTILDRVEAFSDGAAGTFSLTCGDGTTGNNIMAAAGGDVDGGTTKVASASLAVLVDGGVFTATLTGSVNLSTVTAGECKLKVRFAA